MIMVVIYVSAALLSLSLLTYLIPLIYQNYLSARRDVRFYLPIFSHLYKIGHDRSSKDHQTYTCTFICLFVCMFVCVCVISRTPTQQRTLEQHPDSDLADVLDSPRDPHSPSYIAGKNIPNLDRCFSQWCFVPNQTNTRLDSDIACERTVVENQSKFWNPTWPSFI